MGDKEREKKYYFHSGYFCISWPLNKCIDLPLFHLFFVQCCDGKPPFAFFLGNKYSLWHIWSKENSNIFARNAKNNIWFDFCCFMRKSKQYLPFLFFRLFPNCSSSTANLPKVIEQSIKCFHSESFGSNRGSYCKKIPMEMLTILFFWKFSKGKVMFNLVEFLFDIFFLSLLFSCFRQSNHFCRNCFRSNWTGMEFNTWQRPLTATYLEKNHNDDQTFQRINEQKAEKEWKGENWSAFFGSN